MQMSSGNIKQTSNQFGIFITRIENTDRSRSTLEAKLVVIKDLKWLSINWDEDPDVDGSCRAHKQFERTDNIYEEYVEKSSERIRLSLQHFSLSVANFLQKVLPHYNHRQIGMAEKLRLEIGSCRLPVS